MISLDTQHELLGGESGTIYVASDMLFLEGRSWLVASPVPAPDVVPAPLAPVLQAFFSENPGASADLRVLTAKTYTAQGRAHGSHRLFDFIPADGIQATSMQAQNFQPKGGPKRVEGAVASLFGPDRTDLSTLREKGLAVPFYADREIPFQERKAIGYTFRFTVPGTTLQRLVRVAGGPWRALHEMGMRATIANHWSASSAPPVGFAHPENPSQLFGMLEQVVDGPPVDADDGRELLYHPLVCSWASDEDLRGWLRAPDKLSRLAPPVLSLKDVLASDVRSYGHAVRTSVDALRWRGVSEEGIDVWLQQELPAAYREMATTIAAHAMSILSDRAEDRGRDGSTIPTWAWDQMRVLLQQLDGWAAWFPTAESRAVFEAVIPGARQFVNDLEPFRQED